MTQTPLHKWVDIEIEGRANKGETLLHKWALFNVSFAKLEIGELGKRMTQT